MIEAQTKPQILCGKVKIRFIANRHLAETPVQSISTAKSMLRVSTPEGTAMDLLNYPHQAGGLNHKTFSYQPAAYKIKSVHLPQSA